ncbi:MAG: NAD(P)H-dependent glycerol-3-phosphate dehydrogenase [Euzebya sp.]
MGAGSWGSAFATICADAGGEVVVWARREQVAREINTQHRNPQYLGQAELNHRVRATTDPTQALADAQIVVVAVPSHALQHNLEQWRHLVSRDRIVVSLVKGILVDTHQRASQVIRQVWDLPYGSVVVCSGPNLARECAAGLPSATVIAGPETRVTRAVQQVCHTDYFRAYTNTDLIGVELGGAVKNPLAIAAGIADGLGFGDNTKASLMTRGLAEMTRLGLALGGNPLTFSGLAGVGDLMATCMSAQSRNRYVGQELGRGRVLPQILADMTGVPGQVTGVPEGVESSRAILAIAQQAGVEMPIIEHVVAVVHDGVDPGEMARALMGRPPRSEFHGFDQPADQQPQRNER